jgi:hypothetical protein
MSCAAHRCHDRNRSEDAHTAGVGRVICFECYRSRLDRPERMPVFVIPFPRLLRDRELAHRKRMLSHLAAPRPPEASTPA